MNISDMADLVEYYCGKAGLDGNDINRELILQIINSKAAELFEETGHQSNFSTIKSQANIIEYDLPTAGLKIEPTRIIKVFVDTERARKMNWDDLEALQKRNLTVR